MKSIFYFALIARKKKLPIKTIHLTEEFAETINEHATEKLEYMITMIITKPTEHYQSQIRIDELESIRGLSALLIIFYHFSRWNQTSIGIINNGYLMVELFFVLSGFVIFNAYNNKIKTQKDLIRFQFLRLGRLYPVHCVFLFLFLGLEIIKYLLGTKLGILNLREVPFNKNSFEAFWQHIFLVQAIGPTGNNLTFNLAAWSISVEFYTYFIFGLTILFLKRFEIHLFGLVALITIAMLVTESTYGFRELFRCFAGFFVGCLTALSVKNIKIKPMNYLSLIIFILIILFLHLKQTEDFDVAIYFLTAALIVALTLSPNGLLNKALKLKLFTWLGIISYSVYMSHGFILNSISSVLKYVLGYPSTVGVDGRFLFSLSSNETFIIMTIYLILVLIISQLCYMFIEKPFREKSRNFAFDKLI